jgi:non-lysosomal glucosylceramidase
MTDADITEANVTSTLSEWPVLRTYGYDDSARISMPLGGIGTGTIGLGGRGNLRDWQLQNSPSIGRSVSGTFFAIRVARPDGPARARLLEGVLFAEEYEGALGSPTPMAGLPRFGHCSLEIAYPLAAVILDDDDFPVSVRIEAHNPLVPSDADASGLPVIFWRLKVTNKTTEPVEVALLCSVGNFIGDGLRTPGEDGRARPRTATRQGDGLVGVTLSDDGVDPNDEAWGTFAAAVVGDPTDTWTGGEWELGRWNQGLWAMWRNFVELGRPTGGTLGPPPSAQSRPAATVGSTTTCEPSAEMETSFVFAWHFPNRRAWTFAGPGPRGGSREDIVGNHYTESFRDSWDALTQSLNRREELEAKTVSFVEAVVTSDLSPAVKEAALFNLSTLRSPTVFRTADGNPFGWEGVLDDAGSCPGSCTHVWNYEMATPFLFGDLARRMRTLEFAHATADSGAMSFRIMLPLDRAQEWGSAAADGQFGCVIKLYREWQLSGDDQFLTRLWPACKRAVEFAWLEGSWDADVDGVAEGALHNTMDVEYFGPNPLIQGWYIGALRAAAHMAAHLGDEKFARRCSLLAEAGAAWTDDNLFNGDYYVQDIRAPKDFMNVRPELRIPDMGAAHAETPEYQIGTGCLIDQLAGDASAQLTGLGALFDPAHASRALDSIHRLNYVPRFSQWTNYMRSYGLGDDAGHRMVAYPDGVPEHPMPYWCEVMTGFEYTYALSLILASRQGDAEAVVASIRDRYDGRRRNPFDEAECGHHYARAMASWGLIVALTGFHYSAVTGRLQFAPSPSKVRWVWSSGDAWGTLEQTPNDDGVQLRLIVDHGTIEIRELLVGRLAVPDLRPGVRQTGDVLELTLPATVT